MLKQRIMVVVSAVLLVALALSVSAASAVAQAPCLLPGDANGDGVVNILDFSLFVNARYLSMVGEVGYDARVDFNGDGIISILDFTVLAGNYLTRCP